MCMAVFFPFPTCSIKALKSEIYINNEAKLKCNYKM